MTVTDPRAEYDDLVVTESREVLDPEQFAEAAASEAAAASWVIVGFVFDDADRLLLVDEPWADGWIAPGGTREPGESLAETLTREIREETGVEITPVRPRAVDEFTFENGATGETDGWTTVTYEAVADAASIDANLGLDDEVIDDARWFEDLPENRFRPDLTETVYRRCPAERSER